MKKEQAQKLVEEYLHQSELEINSFGSALPDYVNPNIKLQILSDLTETYEFGWVFYYNTENPFDELIGNAPLIVDRNSGKIIVTGTAQSAEYYINNYIKTGDPHQKG